MNMDQTASPADETDEQEADERQSPTSEEQTINALPTSSGGSISPSGSSEPVDFGWGPQSSVHAAASLYVDTQESEFQLQLQIVLVYLST